MGAGSTDRMDRPDMYGVSKTIRCTSLACLGFSGRDDHTILYQHMCLGLVGRKFVWTPKNDVSPGSCNTWLGIYSATKPRLDENNALIYRDCMGSVHVFSIF